MLGTDTVLGGWIMRTAGRLQLKAFLFDARDSQEIWSQRFDRTVQDIMEIQQVITSAVIRKLGLTPGDATTANQLPVEPKAYDFFLRGLSYFSRHTTQDIVYARQMLKQAIEIEPGYGRAWAGVAYTHGFEYMYFNASNVNLAEVRRTSAKALKLAPELAQAHVASGIASCMRHKYRKAEKEFTTAIQLDPGNFQAWYFFARAKVHEGDMPRALKLFDCASRVRPVDYQSVLLQAQLYNSLGREDKAIEITTSGIERVRAALALNPEDNRARNMGAFALWRLGETREAEQWMMHSLENAPMDSIIQYNGACFFSLAGQVDRALDCLENCLVKVGNINREWLVHDSDMNNIRDHPRFAEIIRTFPE
jgi:adenylate cyclase